MIHRNSIDCYHEEEKRFGKRATLILRYFQERSGERFTDRAVMEALGFKEPNAVRPRITELIDAGRLEECGDVICPVTGIRVRLVRFPAETEQATAPVVAEQTRLW